MAVLDASATVELALASDKGRRVQAAIRNELLLDAPELLELEFLHTMNRLIRAGKLSESRADQGIAFIHDLSIARHRHRGLGGRIWQLRHGFGAYDASYVALAEILGVRLVTCDTRLGRGIDALGLGLDLTVIA